MMFLIKMTQVRLILIVAAFLTLTGNFTFLEKTILVYPLSENWLFVGSLLVWLFVFLSALVVVALLPSHNKAYFNHFINDFFYC